MNITDALNYGSAVRQELKLTTVDPGRLLAGMLDTYPEFLANRRQIHLQGPLPSVLANEAGLTQCFSNLIGNALKFLEPRINHSSPSNSAGSAGSTRHQP